MLDSLTIRLLHYYRLIWWAIFICSSLPFLFLLNNFYQQQLGSNPLETLQHTTGKWALIFLLITLTVTPLRQSLNRFCIYIHIRFGRRLEDWNWIIRLRRMLGLYSFFYATLHMLVYTLFDISLSMRWAINDIQEKPYIGLGILSYLLLIPLAITSASKIFMIMGKKRWQRLHKLVYIIIILVIIHFWWQTKVGVYEYVPYALVTVVLLGSRLFNWLGIFHRNEKDDGMEVEPRR